MMIICHWPEKQSNTAAMIGVPHQLLLKIRLRTYVSMMYELCAVGTMYVDLWQRIYYPTKLMPSYIVTVVNRDGCYCSCRILLQCFEGIFAVVNASIKTLVTPCSSGVIKAQNGFSSKTRYFGPYPLDTLSTNRAER